MGDDELVEVEDPKASETLIRRARRKMEDTKLIEHIVRWAVIAAIGAGSSMATREVGDAQHESVVQSNRNDVLKLSEQLEMLRAGFHQRVEVEEGEREEDIEKLRERIRRLETLLEVRMGIAPMPAAAAEAPPPN